MTRMTELLPICAVVQIVLLLGIYIEVKYTRDYIIRDWMHIAKALSDPDPAERHRLVSDLVKRIHRRASVGGID